MRRIITPLSGLVALALLAMAAAAAAFDWDQVAQIALPSALFWLVLFVSCWFFTTDWSRDRQKDTAPRPIREDIGCRLVGCLVFWIGIVGVSVVVAWLMRTS